MKEAKQGEIKFKKADLLQAERYQDRKDLVSALLEDDREYTRKEADTLIEKFMKGRVK